MINASNIPIPTILLEDRSLSLLDRAILPIIAMHSLQYGDIASGIKADKLCTILGINIKEIIICLESLKIKNFVQENIVYNDSERQHFWQVGSNYILALNGEYSQLIEQKDSILDLDLEKITNLESEAFIKLHELGLSKEIWDNWYAQARADDLVSQNFMYDFMEHVNKELIKNKKSNNNLAIHDSTRPTKEQFEMAQFFHKRWQEVYPQHQEPHNMMLEAVNLQILQEIKGFSLHDIHTSIEWLFSNHGKWYRANIKNCILFRKKFDYIKRQTEATSSTNGVVLPVGSNIFDMIDEEF